MSLRKGLNKKIIDFVNSEEGGIDSDKIIKVGGMTFILLLGHVSAEYVPTYAHNNYILHNNFVGLIE
jgi:hypothetical protein